MLRRLFKKRTPTQSFEAQDWRLLARPLPWLSLVKGDRQTPSTRALFQRIYRQSPPEFPTHYAALVDDGRGALRVAAYLHMTQSESLSLLGGLCVAVDVYRALPRQAARELHALGSLATLLVKSASDDRVADAAVFGYLGDSKSRNVSAAAGYVSTRHTNLYVYWRAAAAALPAAQREALVDKAFAAAPF